MFHLNHNMIGFIVQDKTLPFHVKLMNCYFVDFPFEFNAFSFRHTILAAFAHPAVCQLTAVAGRLNIPFRCRSAPFLFIYRSPFHTCCNRQLHSLLQLCLNPIGQRAALKAVRSIHLRAFQHQPWGKLASAPDNRLQLTRECHSVSNHAD